MEEKSFRGDEKSNEQKRDKGKTPQGIRKCENKTWNESQRGEWNENDANNQLGEQAIVSMWIHKGIPNKNEEYKTFIQKCSNCLQSRFRESGANDSDRNGWSEPSPDETEAIRQEKKRGLDGPWMDCNTFAALQTLKILPTAPVSLYRYQIQDIERIEQFEGRALLASEMGLGKTMQALMWLAGHANLRPAVIVVPATLKLNWLKHANNWLAEGEVIQVVSGKTNKEIKTFIIGKGEVENGKEIKKNAIIIINYDIAKEWLEVLTKLKPKVVVADEIHYCKNAKAIRTKAISKLAKFCNYFIGLTGTPIENRPVEFFPILNMIRPGLFPSFMDYARRFCAAKQGYWGWDFSGASNLDELHEILKGVMIRRKKEEVLTDLPEKTREIIVLEASKEELQEYRHAENDILAWILENLGSEKAFRAKMAKAIVEINTLKKLAWKCKAKSAIWWIEDFLESDEKLVVFATHHETIDMIKNQFGKICVGIDGRTPVDKRQAIAEKFQSDKSIKIFVGNIKAAGVGIDLFAASNVAFLELGWTPGEHDQAEDRCHRIGQKDNVTAHYLICDSTIETDIISLIESKRNIVNQVIDGKEIKVEENMVWQLLNKLGEKK